MGTPPTLPEEDTVADVIQILIQQSETKIEFTQDDWENMRWVLRACMMAWGSYSPEDIQQAVLMPKSRDGVWLKWLQDGIIRRAKEVPKEAGRYVFPKLAGTLSAIVPWVAVAEYPPSNENDDSSYLKAVYEVNRRAREGEL